MLEVFKFYMEFVTIIPSFTIYNITRECQINDAVYNGTRLIDVGNENFMSELNVKRCLTSLKIKNCEGSR